MMKIYIAFLLLMGLCFPIFAQDAELRELEAEPLGNHFINHAGTFAFDYPLDWEMFDRLTEYEIYNHPLESFDDLDAGDYMLYLRLIDPLEQMQPLAHLEIQRDHLQGNYDLEEISLAGRYAVMMTGINFDGKVPHTSATIIVQLDDGYYVQVSGYSLEDADVLVQGFVVNIAASIHQIDPQALNIDTDALTEHYSGHGIRFDYPAGYVIADTDALTIIDSTDFSNSTIYDGVIYTPLDLPQINEIEIEGEHRIAFHLMTKSDLEALVLEDDFSYIADLFELLYVDEIPQQEFLNYYRVELNGRPLIWIEGNGGYLHETYFPDIFNMIYELDEDNYLIVEANSYGFGVHYPVRLLMLNMLSTVQLEE